MPVRTKIEISPALVRRISGLDDLARIFFPDNRSHRRAFIAIWVEIKYADDQFLPSTFDFSARYQLSPRILEVVRAKLKRLGIIKRISHFNPAFGYRSGWTFARRFGVALGALTDAVKRAEDVGPHSIDQRKDRDAAYYI